MVAGFGNRLAGWYGRVHAPYPQRLCRRTYAPKARLQPHTPSMVPCLMLTPTTLGPADLIDKLFNLFSWINVRNSFTGGFCRNDQFTLQQRYRCVPAVTNTTIRHWAVVKTYFAPTLGSQLRMSCATQKGSPCA